MLLAPAVSRAVSTPALAELPHDAVEGVALADRAQVERHAGAEKAHFAGGGVELEVFHADAFARLGQLGVGRAGALRVSGSPRPWTAGWW